LLFEYSLSGKWLELLKQIAPNVGRARLSTKPLPTAFLEGLQQSGWTIGQNVRIDSRWARPMPSKFADTRDASLKFRIVCWCGQEHADAPYRLLRVRRERPGHCRAPEQRYERAAIHSITSSARASSASSRDRIQTDEALMYCRMTLRAIARPRNRRHKDAAKCWDHE
jgi:hypothetical protein